MKVGCKTVAISSNVLTVCFQFVNHWNVETQQLVSWLGNFHSLSTAFYFFVLCIGISFP